MKTAVRILVRNSRRLGSDEFQDRWPSTIYMTKASVYLCLGWRNTARQIARHYTYARGTGWIRTCLINKVKAGSLLASGIGNEKCKTGV